MKLGILSDTHDDLLRTQFAVGVLREFGAESLVHCGDVGGVEIIAACSVLPLWFVFGNNDDRLAELERAAVQQGATCLGWSGVVEFGGKRIGIAHGHRPPDVRRLLAAKPDYFFYGHSHIAADAVADGVRKINPGALYRAAELSVALLDLSRDRLEFLPIPKPRRPGKP